MYCAEPLECHAVENSIDVEICAKEVVNQQKDYYSEGAVVDSLLIY